MRPAGLCGPALRVRIRICYSLLLHRQRQPADLSPSTVRSYETCITRSIQPTISDVPFERLRVA
jgi:hypothetical protein